MFMILLELWNNETKDETEFFLKKKMILILVYKNIEHESKNVVLYISEILMKSSWSKWPFFLFQEPLYMSQNNKHLSMDETEKFYLCNM